MSCKNTTKASVLAMLNKLGWDTLCQIELLYHVHRGTWNINLPRGIARIPWPASEQESHQEVYRHPSTIVDCLLCSTFSRAVHTGNRLPAAAVAAKNLQGFNLAPGQPYIKWHLLLP